MKVLLINTVLDAGGASRVCVEIAKKLIEEGNEVKVAYGRGSIPEFLEGHVVRIGSDFEVYLHVLRSRLLDEHGYGSKWATQKFLNWTDGYAPDLLWLHNIHGYYLNYAMLFGWIKDKIGLQVKWTLHDCWAFTGHCGYFSFVKCERWKTGCSGCPQLGQYPRSLWRDNSRKSFELKKKAFTGVKNLTLITPSQWLKDLVGKSFLKEYPVEVRYNTIDTDVFKPTPSDFRERYGIGDRKMILGVASVWEKRKGLDDFIELAQMLDDQHVIVLVGVNDKQIRKLPERIIVIKRTKNPTELAEIYTAADVFVNPTYEDNYPTVNLEAAACGTFVVTYKTGGSPETIDDLTGVAVEQGDIFAIFCIIRG